MVQYCIFLESLYVGTIRTYVFNVQVIPSIFSPMNTSIITFNYALPWFVFSFVRFTSAPFFISNFTVSRWENDKDWREHSDVVPNFLNR